MAPSLSSGCLSWRSCLAITSSLLLSYPLQSSALDLNINSTDSIMAAAKAIVPNMVSYYHGDQPGGTPGVMPYPPYYWWEGAEFFSCLIDYWYYTGDTQYNQMVIQGMEFQRGQFSNFEPVNQTFDLGNDDQVFWAFASMDAAEYGFDNPPADEPSWLSLAQAVFNRQTERWDPSSCGGGLRWQIFIANQGYNYKNTIANGGLFQLSARLGAFTKNETYFYWANRLYDWIDSQGLISPTWQVYDGVQVANCSDITYLQWSYNLGVLMYGSAVMWNATGEEKWQNRTAGFLSGMNTFFHPTPYGDVMEEVECEPNGICNEDMQSYKNDFSRWLAATTRIANWTTSIIDPYLQTSAIGAAKACTGPGGACGLRWYTGEYDGQTGLGEEMDALAIMLANLVKTKLGPVNVKTGGNSTSNGAAGIVATTAPKYVAHVTKADNAGAAILTILFLGGTLAVAVWMVI